MSQMREFAQRKADFDHANAQLVAISVDDLEHNRAVWNQAANQKIRLLSDPEAKVIRKYGLLHAQGHGGDDIAIRATLIIDEQGREIYRNVSGNAIETQKA